MGGRNPPWGATGPSGGRRLLGATFIFYRLLRGSKKLTPVRERQEGRERQSRKKASEISGPQPRGGAGARGGRTDEARGRGRIRTFIPAAAAGPLGSTAWMWHGLLPRTTKPQPTASPTI